MENNSCFEFAVERLNRAPADADVAAYLDFLARLEQNAAVVSDCVVYSLDDDGNRSEERLPDIRRDTVLSALDGRNDPGLTVTVLHRDEPVLLIFACGAVFASSCSGGKDLAREVLDSAVLRQSA